MSARSRKQKRQSKITDSVQHLKGAGGPQSKVDHNKASVWGDISNPSKLENPLEHLQDFKDNYENAEMKPPKTTPHSTLPKEKGGHRPHVLMDPVLERSVKAYAKHGETCFVWEHGGSKVQIAGEFSKWQPHNMHKPEEEGPWVYCIKLKPGKHVFKFIVDGTWRYDSQKATERDQDGNINNIIIIPNETQTPEETM